MVRRCQTLWQCTHLGLSKCSLGDSPNGSGVLGSGRNVGEQILRVALTWSRSALRDSGWLLQGWKEYLKRRHHAPPMNSMIDEDTHHDYSALGALCQIHRLPTSNSQYGPLVGSDSHVCPHREPVFAPSAPSADRNPGLCLLSASN